MNSEVGIRRLEFGPVFALRATPRQACGLRKMELGGEMQNVEVRILRLKGANDFGFLSAVSLADWISELKIDIAAKRRQRHLY